MPILALAFVVVVHRCTFQGLDMKFLLRQVWSCLIEQVILVTFKKRSSQIWRVSVSEHRTPWWGFPVQTKSVLGFPKISVLRMNETSNFRTARVFCSLTFLSCMTNASGFPETFWAYSGELSISIFGIRVCSDFRGIVEMRLRLYVGRLWYFRIRHTSRPNLAKFLHFFGDRSSGIFFSNFLLYIV